MAVWMAVCNFVWYDYVIIFIGGIVVFAWGAFVGYRIRENDERVTNFVNIMDKANKEDEKNT